MTYVFEYLISFAMAFIISFIATPTARNTAFRIGAVDVPRDNRRMHKKPVARLGGLAIAAGFLLTILFNVVLSLTGFDIFPADQKLLGLLGGVLIIECMGVADDIKPLKAKMKLVFQVLAAIVVVVTGTEIKIVTNPFSETGITLLPSYISIPLTVLWIVGITNAFNLIDGLDGLAAGVSSIASLSLFFISILRIDEGPDIYTAIMTASLAGATLGFLPYNFNPAKIFMGETGSAFLGFTLGVISIQGTLKTYTAISIAIPLLVLGLPLFDTILAIFRRVMSRKPIMEADRGHLHHKLIDMGLTQKQTVVVMYASSAALGLCAIVLADSGPFSALILVIAISVFIIAGAKFMSGINGESNYKNNDKRLCLKIDQAGRVRDMNKIRVMTVFGTRPEAVKMAPLVMELEKCDKIDSVVCVTAQHREMLDQVLRVFDIKPDYDLNIMQEKQTLLDITTRVLEGLSCVLDEVKPDIVLVHGDTSTTFAGSLAAFYKKISVGHVEAGLRTFDKYSPYPEEMNRKLTASLADLHFCPTMTNKRNLLNENIPENGIYITGNTVIDAIATTVREDYCFENPLLRDLDYKNCRIIAVTAHRRENLGEPLRNICRALKRIVDAYEDVRIVYPVHLNPVVQETAREILGNHPSVFLTDPVSMQDMHNLMSRSYMVMTDSGGLQEEAPALGKPVLVLRNDTERPEAVEAGTVKLAGTDEDKIFASAAKLLDDGDEYNRMAKAVNPYGDGKASQRIVQALLYEFGLSDQKPEEFCAM